MIIVAVIVITLLGLCGLIFGLKTAQLNKLPGGDEDHLIVGRIMWGSSVLTLAAIVFIVIKTWIA
jgi:hypothetical protein